LVRSSRCFGLVVPRARVSASAGMAEDLILNELEAKIRTLDEYKAKIEELRIENNDLLTKLQTKEQDAMEVIKYLRAENDSLQEKLRIYSEESATAKSDAETTVRTANEERDRAIAEMEAKFKHNEEQRETDVRKLREELFALKAFKDREEVLETELKRVHQELSDAQAAHKEAMTGVERKLIEEKTRLQKEAHAQLMEIKRNTYGSPPVYSCLHTQQHTHTHTHTCMHAI
jgi:DNA repair exonuclease SbcCD ATPase subunit